MSWPVSWPTVFMVIYFIIKREDPVLRLRTNLINVLRAFLQVWKITTMVVKPWMNFLQLISCAALKNVRWVANFSEWHFCLCFLRCVEMPSAIFYIGGTRQDSEFILLPAGCKLSTSGWREWTERLCHCSWPISFQSLVRVDNQFTYVMFFDPTTIQINYQVLPEPKK